MLRKVAITINTENIPEKYFYTLTDEGSISTKSGEIIKCRYLAPLFDEVYKIKLFIYDEKDKKTLIGKAVIAIDEHHIEFICHGIVEANYTFEEDSEYWGKDIDREILPVEKGFLLKIVLSNNKGNSVVEIGIK